jgi:hypothetical protein
MSETQKAGSVHNLARKKPLQTNYENSELIILVSGPAIWGILQNLATTETIKHK